MKPAEFIGILFLARDHAHSAHLSTKSFAAHSALNTFYHDIIDVADSFAEAYQGRYGLLGAIPLQSARKESSALDLLEKQLNEIEDNRYDICDKDETALQNIIDEIVAVYLSAIYKLKFLS